MSHYMVNCVGIKGPKMSQWVGSQDVKLSNFEMINRSTQLS